MSYLTDFIHQHRTNFY